jgi:hypothetical protein
MPSYETSVCGAKSAERLYAVARMIALLHTSDRAASQLSDQAAVLTDGTCFFIYPYYSTQPSCATLTKHTFT